MCHVCLPLVCVCVHMPLNNPISSITLKKYLTLPQLDMANLKRHVAVRVISPSPRRHGIMEGENRALVSSTQSTDSLVFLRL